MKIRTCINPSYLIHSLVIMILLFTGGFAGEMKINLNALPDAVVKAFKQAYPNATIKSAAKEEENGQEVYEIESVDGKQARDILYSADGNAIEIEEEIAFEKLPDAVQSAIKTKYPKAEVEKAEKLTKGDTTEFEVLIEINEEEIEILFDGKGTIVKSESSKEKGAETEKEEEK